MRDARPVAVEREHHYVVRFGGVPDRGSPWRNGEGATPEAAVNETTAAVARWLEARPAR